MFTSFENEKINFLILNQDLFDLHSDNSAQIIHIIVKLVLHICKHEFLKPVSSTL